MLTRRSVAAGVDGDLAGRPRRSARRVGRAPILLAIGLVAVLAGVLGTMRSDNDGAPPATGDRGTPSGPDPPAPASERAKLSWAPPPLRDPSSVRVRTDPEPVVLDSDRDYIIEMPSSPVTGAMAISGGHNVVLIGGEIAIPWQGDDATSSDRRGLLLRDQTGTVHIEGLLIHGEDVSEGIQIAAPEARVQLQNVRVENLHARDQVEFTDNHPDVVQPWGGVRELLIDRLTGESDYQGLYLPVDRGPIGRVVVRRVNIVGADTARYLLWTDGSYPLELDRVYVRPAPTRSWQDTIWCEGDCAVVRRGMPPHGDFAPAGTPGIGYRTPGYD